MEVKKLIPLLWGEWRFDKKSSKWTKKENTDDGIPLPRSFVEFCLDPINRVVTYCLEDNREKLGKFLKANKLELTPEQHQLTAKKLCKVVLHTWLDASVALMDSIAIHLPPPNVSQV